LYKKKKQLEKQDRGEREKKIIIVMASCQGGRPQKGPEGEKRAFFDRGGGKPAGEKKKSHVFSPAKGQ